MTETSDKLTARDRILAAANDLFYREGIRAIGIDTVIERAGVAKMSLYRAFPSKDDLIAAFLEMRDSMYWDWWDAVLARHPNDPRRQLLALFETVARRTSDPLYRGCPFVNTSVEFPHPDHPARAVVARHFAELRRRLGALAEGIGLPQSSALTDQLMVLLEGAYSACSTLGGAGPSASVAAAAEILIQAHLSATLSRPT
ncbi:Transcriptional regulator TetR family [Paramagnetospirillum magnetotacticum MS-1]|uniref:Transcriptional regulator TetR family n=1 Tax=Paramagnetospirillum magnetotacticum MS-1 TaxID=272627 RepID=A0A0C2YXH8_PARME|nr:TetR/AcrR family transcriptional regulator [Paramagnetospirillum magnetotacticum]KIL99405.1 Transcriptional regulator TetR family [Paramagnetospirillum magnetotacticum MS-1]